MCLVRHLADRCQSRAAMGRMSHDPTENLTTRYRKGVATYSFVDLEFACGCENTAETVSSAVQVKLGSRLEGGDCEVTRHWETSYQSSLVRGKMSSCAVQSSDVLQAFVRGTRGKRIGEETGSNEW